MSIIDGEPYNAKKLNKLKKERELSYDKLYISLQDDINSIINDLYYNPILSENKRNNFDIQNILETFYLESLNIDKNYYQLMSECKSKFPFPLQRKEIYIKTDIFPSLINVIEHNNMFFDYFALTLLEKQYEFIINKIIQDKTHNFMNYINYFTNHSEIDILEIKEYIGYNYYYEINNYSIFDYFINQCKIERKTDYNINILNINTLESSLLNIPAVNINDTNYSLFAVNEIKKSMEIISPHLIKNIKNILLNGINYQTEIYTKNTDKYVDWYFSYFTNIDKTITNIGGFITGEKSIEEKFYLDNFNRIMNNNANFYKIIEKDVIKQETIILNIYNEYINLKDYFTVNIYLNEPEIMSFDDYIGSYINEIIKYIEQVFEALDQANNFYHQDYTIKNNEALNAAKTTYKILAEINFFGSLALDYITLKTQKSLNSAQLKQQIIESMNDNQKNKIAIINDPFNYLYEKLKIGSIIYVDNYFAALNTYQHYGIYIGNGNVIHFAPLEGQEISFENGIIHETTLEKFLNGRALQIDTNVKNSYSEDEIIQRAKSKLNEKGYNLFTNNCEHFARWCVTGEHISYQIENLPQKIDNTLYIIDDNIYMITKFLELFN